MNNLFIPTEDDFRRWIKEAVTESLANAALKKPADEKDSQLLSRKEIAAFLGISLVTLTDWMRGVFRFTRSMAGSTSSAPGNRKAKRAFRQTLGEFKKETGLAE